MMARVARMKGIAVLSALSFLRETHGAEACDAVLGELNAEAQARIRTSCREASWHPVEDLTALMEIARRRLAADDPEFLRKLGRYSGARERATAGFDVMLAEPATTMRLGPVAWKAFYDTGDLEIVVVSPTECLARIRGFPATRALCQRFTGALEGLLSTATLKASTREEACVALGDELCVLRIVWE
jgi:hypothetical protein